MSAPRQAIIYIIRGPDPTHMYIGKTTLSTAKRLDLHRSRALHDGRTSKLYSAMREHGVKNFKIETLESINSEDAHNAERRHILERNAHKVGLNMLVPRLQAPQAPQRLDAEPGALVPYRRDSTP